MSPRRSDPERIQDLLDGLLSPEEEAELRRDLALRGDLAREYREMAAVVALLTTSLDVDAPRELAGRVLAAVAADRERRRSLLRMPARLQNGLVLAGAAGLAAAVALLARAAGPSGAEWVGRAVVGSTRVFALAKAAALDLAQWDWIFRLLETLGRASATAFGSSALPLFALSLAALGLTAVLGVAWLRGSRSLRSGGFGHAHLLA
jgi:anti-sigma factor RsiW